MRRSDWVGGRNTSDAVTFHHDGSRHRQRESEVVPARREEVVTREGFGRSSHPETLPPRICPLNPSGGREPRAWQRPTDPLLELSVAWRVRRDFCLASEASGGRLAAHRSRMLCEGGPSDKPIHPAAADRSLDRENASTVPQPLLPSAGVLLCPPGLNAHVDRGAAGALPAEK